MKVIVPQQEVLDHGYVKYIDSMGTDETIIEAARMSTGRGFERWEKGLVCKVCREPQRSPDIYERRHANDHAPEWIEVPGDAKLLEYLFSNGHTTPFEMCELHVEVCAPIFVWRQWHRHRTFSYNEQSARYGPLPDLFYVPTEDRIRESFEASANKQASGAGDDEEAAFVARYIAKPLQFENEQRADRAMYLGRLNLGMAPELARINVPVSQYSKCRVKTDLHNWLNFLRLRMDAHAQAEIRAYASVIGSLIEQLWPRTWALFEEYTLGAVRFSKTEIAVVRELVQYAPQEVRTAIKRPTSMQALLKKLGLEG